MASRELVSVVMSVHNGERFLRASLASVLSQEGVNLEFVIIDDAETSRKKANGGRRFIQRGLRRQPKKIIEQEETE